MADICTTCPYCGVGCGVSAQITGEREIAVKGNVAHPANRGSLCSKGTHLGETVTLDGRLLHPELDGARASWGDALDQVAGKLRDCVAEHGPDSVAFYVSGQLLTEDYYAANKLLKGFVGTANIDTNSRLCMASAVVAHNRAFGEDVVPCSYSDLEDADLIVLVGSNTTWCHPVLWQRIEKARESREIKLVVIDPRRTETAERADLHLAIEPDGDVPLFSALLVALRDRGQLDEAFINERCNLPDGFWDSVSAFEHGIDDAQFTAFVELVEAHPKMVTMFSQGANQSVQGSDKGNAIINLHLATGRINKPGTGPFSITGQPNAMGGREVGGLASTLACHLNFSQEELVDAAAFWNAPNMCSGPGKKAVDLFRDIHSGKIKFLWVMATNPAVSMPDTSFVREALERCPTVVVSDIMADTDTGRYANIRLPALGWGEKDGTVTNSERVISRQRKIFDAPGEARADWDIVSDVARRMGHEEAFSFTSSASVFREYAAMTKLAPKHGKLLDLTHLADNSDADYEAMAPFQWGGKHPCSERFATPNGRANLLAPTCELKPAANTSDKFPLRLNTGRYRDQWHTMTRTGLSAKLSGHKREPLLEVHPQDAAKFALSDGGLAEVKTPYGASTFRVEFSNGQRLGDIYVPMHWTDVMGSGGRAGLLCKPDVDPFSGQPGFKDTPATLSPVEPEWRAFLLTREIAAPSVEYWVRSRINDGWLTEIAGFGNPDPSALLPEQAEGGRQAEVADLKRGMRRIVQFTADDQIEAALYITRNGQLPDRDWIIRQFAAPDAQLAELLAARPSTPMPDRGALICICHDVGELEIRETITEGARSVAEVGKANCAGTNCGSCRPAIARMLEEQLAQLEEAAQ